jgi:hypothetical protein
VVKRYELYIVLEYPEEARSSQVGVKFLVRDILTKAMSKLSVPSVVLGSEKKVKVQRVDVQDVEYE